MSHLLRPSNSFLSTPMNIISWPVSLTSYLKKKNNCKVLLHIWEFQAFSMISRVSACEFANFLLLVLQIGCQSQLPHFMVKRSCVCNYNFCEFEIKIVFTKEVSQEQLGVFSESCNFFTLNKSTLRVHPTHAHGPELVVYYAYLHIQLRHSEKGLSAI